MKSILSIVVTVLYLTFNIGITLKIHTCADMDMTSHSKAISHQESTSASCHSEKTHSCCENSNDMDCCSETETADNCCFNSDLLFKVKQEQIIPPSYQIVVPSIDLEKDLTSISFNTSTLSNDVYLVKHPPPLKEDKHVLYCSLIYYA